MKIGICVLSHNSYAHFERLALSLHNQTWPDWKGYVLDVDSSDQVEKLMWPMNKVNNCGILKDRFNYHQIIRKGEVVDGINIAMQDLVGELPVCQLIAFCDANMRLTHQLLASVHSFLTSDIDVVQVEAREPQGEETKGFVSFIRRSVVEKFPPILSPEGEKPTWTFTFSPEVRTTRLGVMGLVEWFE